LLLNLPHQPTVTATTAATPATTALASALAIAVGVYVPPLLVQDPWIEMGLFEELKLTR